MQKVFTDVLHPLVASGNEAARLVTRLGAFLFSGKFTLLALEIPFSLGEVFRIGEMLAVPGNGKIDQPDINACETPAFRHDGGRGRAGIFRQDRCVIVAARLPRNRHGFDAPIYRAMLHDLDQPNLGKANAAALDLHPLRILDRLPAVILDWAVNA